MSAIEGLEPKGLWLRFLELSRIPHASGNEEGTREYLWRLAEAIYERQPRCMGGIRDESGNLYFDVPATPGFEHAPTVILQAHMDMVPAKRAGSTHDFDKDPIELIRDGNRIHANGTTLGADNDIGLAASLAIVEDPTAVHGPLQLVFTYDEERGLIGAKNLDESILSKDARFLLNLDTEEEGTIYIGCAGGIDTVAEFIIETEEAPDDLDMTAVRLRIDGLRGGHSGADIHMGLKNAIVLMSELLCILDRYGARISSLNGGDKRNAIPSWAEAVVFISRDRYNDLEYGADRYLELIETIIVNEDDQPVLTWKVVEEAPRSVWHPGDQEKVLRALRGLPHGVMDWDENIPGFVETSTNLAAVRTKEDEVVIETSQRSSDDDSRERISDYVTRILESCGTVAGHENKYPGWNPNLESPLLAIANDTYASTFGKEPVVTAIHAGLECGVFRSKMPGLDMISFGPTIKKAHTPDEYVEIASVDRFYTFLKAVLERVARSVPQQ